MTNSKQNSRFYTYKLTDNEGKVAYIGKGSGNRLDRQMKRYQMQGEYVTWHKNERYAYSKEVQLIAELKPYLNKKKGGNGKYALPKPPEKRVNDPFYKLCDKLGTRVVAARICMNYWYMFEPSKVEQIRKIAYGQG